MTRLDEIEARARKAALMIDIGPLTDEQWAACAAACNDVPALVAVARFALSQHAPDGHGNCGPCDDATGEDGWPCSTVREIHRMLGEDD